MNLTIGIIIGLLIGLSIGQWEDLKKKFQKDRTFFRFDHQYFTKFLKLIKNNLSVEELYDFESNGEKDSLNIKIKNFTVTYNEEIFDKVIKISDINGQEIAKIHYKFVGGNTELHTLLTKKELWILLDKKENYEM